MNTLKFGNGEWYGKKDTILAYNDENSNFKPLPFSFDRASSATRVNKDGLIETVGSNEPRVDYLDNTKGALKLEPSRTNLITQSEAFDNAYWTKSGASVTSGFISLNGNTNAYNLVEDTSTGNHAILNSPISSLSGDISISIFAKKGERNWIRLTNNNVVGAYFNLNDGTIGTTDTDVTANIQDYGNGWYRCSIFKNRATAATERLIIYTSVDGTSTSYQGNGTSGIYVWGAMVEQGSYATSYIPTQGGVVTRVDEVVNNTNSLMSGLTDMAMFIDYQLPNGNSAGFRNQLGFRDNNNANFYMIQFPNSNTHEFRYTGVAGVNIDMTPSISEQDFGLRRKLLYTKTGTTLKVFCNGVEVSTVTNASATTFSTTPERLNAGDNYDFDMDIKEWKLYNNGFTDAEAITLTTI